MQAISYSKGKFSLLSIHYKKITNSIICEEEGITYLLISDKFGEIYLKGNK
jgi:hypothetical protein